MPDRDTFVKHVPIDWWQVVRCLFEPDLHDDDVDRAVKQLAVEVSGVGCPSLLDICSVIGSPKLLDTNSGRTNDFQNQIIAIDDLVRADNSLLSELLAYVARPIIADRYGEGGAGRLGFDNLVEHVLRESLVALAAKRMFPTVQAHNVVDSGRWTLQQYLARREEILSRLRSSNRLGQLIGQLKASPDGSSVTVPRMKVRRVSTAELVHMPLTIQME